MSHVPKNRDMVGSCCCRPSLTIHGLRWTLCFTTIFIILSQNLSTLRRIHNSFPNERDDEMVLFHPPEIIQHLHTYQKEDNNPSVPRRNAQKKQEHLHEANKERKRKRMQQLQSTTEMLLPPRIDPAWLLYRLDRRQAATTTNDVGDVSTVDNETNVVCQEFPGDGVEGRRGYQALNKIRFFLSESTKQQRAHHQQQQQHPLSANSNSTPSLRLLCLVFTDSSRPRQLASVVDTYAPRCDGVVVFSNITDHSKGTVSLKLETKTAPTSGDVVVSTEWIEICRAFQYVHNYFLDDYDAFHFAPDDSFVVIENLRIYLMTLIGRVKQRARKSYENFPLYLGAPMPMLHDPKRRFCDGRAGFSINRNTLTRISTKLRASPSNDDCGNATLPVDQRIADCLYQEKIACADTSDRDHGSRYHPFTIHARSNLFPTDKNTSFPWKELPKYHKVSPRGGSNGISAETISFRSNHHYRYHAILYGACDAVWEKHWGALDEHGNHGYVHNVTYLKHHPVPFDYRYGDCDPPFGNGTEGPVGYQGLQKIRIASSGDKKVLCMVYTHSQRHHRLRAIAETYAPRCDGFFAGSNLTDRTIGAVHILHEGPELYGNMWLKIRAMLEYAYDHYLYEYDFFMIGGDDYYVVAENLKYLVSTGSWRGPWNHSEPLFLGGSLINMPYTRRRYCGGGAGYALNRVALRLLIEHLWRMPSCWPHHRASDEDRIISSCFDAVGIRCMDTNDIRNETTFHNLDAEFHASWNNQRSSPWMAKDLDAHHGIASVEGLGQISRSSVSFHLKNNQGRASRRSRRQIAPLLDDGIRRYHVILYDLCNATLRR